MEAPTLATMPRTFFKYRSLADGQLRGFTRDIIVNNRLYWPSPLDFNDPFDCAPTPVVRATRLRKEIEYKRLIGRQTWLSPREQRSALKRALVRRDEDVETAMRLSIQAMLGAIAVCSVSEIGDSVLMWSHYADAHRGICLRFKRIVDERPLWFTDDQLHFEFALPVFYSPDRPLIDMVRGDPGDTLQQMLLTKADFWSYEREWRMIDHKAPAGVRAFPSACLDAVIFGARIADETRREVLAWVEERGAPLKVLQAVFDDRHFRLGITGD